MWRNLRQYNREKRLSSADGGGELVNAAVAQRALAIFSRQSVKNVAQNVPQVGLRLHARATPGFLRH